MEAFVLDVFAYEENSLRNPHGSQSQMTAEAGQGKRVASSATAFQGPTWEGVCMRRTSHLPGGATLQ